VPKVIRRSALDALLLYAFPMSCSACTVTCDSLAECTAVQLLMGIARTWQAVQTSCSRAVTLAALLPSRLSPTYLHCRTSASALALPTGSPNTRKFPNFLDLTGVNSMRLEFGAVHWQKRRMKGGVRISEVY
jgi:hypothetical protein